jgi:hypothetical protein
MENIGFPLDSGASQVLLMANEGEWHENTES